MSGEAAKDKVTVTGTAPAQVIVFPSNYWEYDKLNLYFKSNTDQSVDDEGAKKYKKKANAPLSYVKTMQTDLKTLAYNTGTPDGAYGGGTARAVRRFQHHARRIYRLKGVDQTGDDVKPDAVFAGAETGICDQATAKEIQTWKTKGWVSPVGRFALTALKASGKLRSDAADEWEKVVKAVEDKGGYLSGPYDDTARSLFSQIPKGASPTSFHYSGRAVDIGIPLGGGKGQRYWIAKDSTIAPVFWRLYCKTDKQDGTQGTKFEKGGVKCWQWANNAKGGAEYSIPAGHYLDLTAEIESGGKFERISAQNDWETVFKKQEWWHFQYTVDKQPSFLDEMELVGFTEAHLRAVEITADDGTTFKPWDSDAALDKKPG